MGNKPFQRSCHRQYLKCGVMVISWMLPLPFSSRFQEYISRYALTQLHNKVNNKVNKWLFSLCSVFGEVMCIQDGGHQGKGDLFLLRRAFSGKKHLAFFTLQCIMYLSTLGLVQDFHRSLDSQIFVIDRLLCCGHMCHYLLLLRIHRPPCGQLQGTGRFSALCSFLWEF